MRSDKTMQDDKTMEIVRKMSAGVFLYGIFALLCFLGSCQSDDLQFKQDELNKGNLTLHINLPGIQGIPTYAASEIDENEVLTVDVLVFNASDNKFLYHVAGSNISNGANVSQKTFNVKIKQTSDPSSVYLLVIANAKTQVDDALTAGTIAVGKERNEIMRNLTFPSVDKWGVPPGPFTRFPMWGQSGNILLTASTVTIDPISLVRAVAKIDVGLKFENNAFSGLGNVFKLEEIYLYNSLTGLLVCPDPDNLNSDLKSVKAPSVPSSATANAVIQYLVNSQNDNAAKISYTNRIYTGEHLVGSNDTRPDNLCLVIGGRFGSEAAEGTAITYYRVDFIKTTRNSEGVITKQEYLPVLRNHFYRVNITKVHNRGYDTKEDAFNAMGLNANLMVEISDDDSDIKDIVYDGQYMLGVSQSNYLLDKPARTGKELIVSTTYPGGWKATSNSTWLTIQNASSTTSGKSTLKFDLAANDATNAVQRTGTITLQAGRLFKVITVVQSAIVNVEFINVSDFYIMDSNMTYTFNIKSPYAWCARVDLGNDPSNILQRGFTTSGAANITTGAPFSFKLENDIVYRAIINATATVTIYSPTDEFESVNVSIRGVSAFTLGGLDVCAVDLPKNQNWTQYRDACAALPSSTVNPWRMPKISELSTIYNATGGKRNVEKYNFVYNAYYWSSSPYTGAVDHYFVNRFSDGSGNYYYFSITNLYCRCVRTK